MSLLLLSPRPGCATRPVPSCSRRRRPDERRREASRLSAQFGVTHPPGGEEGWLARETESQWTAGERRWTADSSNKTGGCGRGLPHFLSCGRRSQGGFRSWDPPPPRVDAEWGGVQALPAAGFQSRALRKGAGCSPGLWRVFQPASGRALSWGPRSGKFPPRKGKQQWRRVLTRPN